MDHGVKLAGKMAIGSSFALPDWNVRVWIGFGFLELVQSKLERVDLIYIPRHAEYALCTSTVQSQHLTKGETFVLF